MASPAIEVFALFDPATGNPVTGATPTFVTYKDSSGSNLSQPSITEIGGGFYKFTVTFSDPTKGVVYIVSSGTSTSWRYARPEDWNDDQIPTVATSASSAATSAAAAASASLTVRKIQTNHWKIIANQLVIYDDDKTTPIYVFNLYDDTGAPSMTKIFERTPTP